MQEICGNSSTRASATLLFPTASKSTYYVDGDLPSIQNSSCGRAADRTPLSRLQPCMQFWLRYTLSTRWRRRIPLLGQGFDTSKQVAELRRFKPKTRIEIWPMVHLRVSFHNIRRIPALIAYRHSSYRILAKWTSYVRVVQARSTAVPRTGPWRMRGTWGRRQRERRHRHHSVVTRLHRPLATTSPTS